MIDKIIEFSIRNRFLVLAVTALIAVWGAWAAYHTPVDAIPDLSENQLIVFTDWMGHSPQEIEDQVTYPLSSQLQGLAGVKTVRSSSQFNFSMINVIFDESSDFYFARDRVSERLDNLKDLLPAGANTYLAPDATATGQIFWYTVEGEGRDVVELRSIQDWYVRYQLQGVPGVAEVASVGGRRREFQVDVNPEKLRTYGISLHELHQAVQRSNSAVGGRVIEKGNAEFVIRSVGWIESIEDIENTVVTQRNGVPIYVRNVPSVHEGTGFRRGVLEKNGREAVGGVVLMRFGENPLEITARIKKKITQLQAGLPEGVRIVPFYDRTPLIHGAIGTVTGVLIEAMITASILIMLILGHFRSAIVICLTLPLAVLFSFLLMRWLDVPSNIMSLAGIAISIGVLVDSSIVMVENASHRLSHKFGGKRITGDNRAEILAACKTVGRPIFFSILIMLVSFVPVFALSGMEGKMFRPLAWTKSLALVGVALLAITFVPALLPTFLRGRLRREEDNRIVRGFISIYRPMLSWFMNRLNLVIGSLAALCLFALGLIPSPDWFFKISLAIVLGLTLWFTRGAVWKAVAFASLLILALVASRFTKLGGEFMPPLDEGTLLDMATSIPRASVTQVAADLRARDSLLREYPEIALVVGKAGRAETPTDPAPLEMFETVIQYEPRTRWPKRQLKYDDALRQAAAVYEKLVEAGVLKPAESDGDAESFVNEVTMAGATKLDSALRKQSALKLQHYRTVLARELTEQTARNLIEILAKQGSLPVKPSDDQLKAWVDAMAKSYGLWFARQPLRDDVQRFAQKLAGKLIEAELVENDPNLLALKPGTLVSGVEGLGVISRLVRIVKFIAAQDKPTLVGVLHEQLVSRRDELLSERIEELNWELFDRTAGTFNMACLEEFIRVAKDTELLAEAPSKEKLLELRQQLDKPFTAGLLLWKKSKEDLLAEMDTALKTPGYGNIWTKPIQNRVDMLATGARMMVAVKVFGDDLNVLQDVSNKVKEVLEKVDGAADVTPDQIVGKPYLEIHIDREKAARYGVNVGDIQDTIEVALGGKVVTTVIDGRARYPVRVRYARDFRVDEEDVRRLLVTAQGPMSRGHDDEGRDATSAEPRAALQIPLSELADIRVLEGPNLIKGEGGLLCSYVQCNVRGRDVVGFVEEAQRAIAAGVELPRGVYLEWGGQFEHQVRAGRTLMVILPIVVLVIFIILYFTYKDLSDALLMMLAIPGALAGGVMFQWLFGYNFSVAVWVGYIACFGMATETGVIMLVYLREAVEQKGGLANIHTVTELRETIMTGAVHRLRPKILTEATAIIGIAPFLWASGVGAEVIRPMAAPVLGGLLIADEVIDVFLPVLFFWVRRRRWEKLHGIAGDIAFHAESSGGQVKSQRLEATNSSFASESTVPGVNPM